MSNLPHNAKRRLPSLLVRWLGPRKTRDRGLAECQPTPYATRTSGKVCCEDIIYPHLHTSGIQLVHTRSTTSDIVLDYHIEFPRFNQPIDKASMTLYIM